MYLRRLKLEDFCQPEEARLHPAQSGALEVCCICETEKKESAILLDLVRQMEEKDRKAFYRGIKTLLKVANSGRPLETHYDENKCHPTHSFLFEGKERKVMRIRTSDLRILFFYGENKILLIIDAFVKHSDTIKKKQKNNAEEIIKKYLNSPHVEFV